MKRISVTIVCALLLGLGVVVYNVYADSCTSFENHKIGTWNGNLDCVYREYFSCEKCTDDNGKLLCLDTVIDNECTEENEPPNPFPHV